jgi:capsule polysaccharide export protein KpsE/RkpR
MLCQLDKCLTLCQCILAQRHGDSPDIPGIRTLKTQKKSFKNSLQSPKSSSSGLKNTKSIALTREIFFEICEAKLAK